MPPPLPLAPFIALHRRPPLGRLYWLFSTEKASKALSSTSRTLSDGVQGHPFAGKDEPLNNCRNMKQSSKFVSSSAASQVSEPAHTEQNEDEMKRDLALWFSKPKENEPHESSKEKKPYPFEEFAEKIRKGNAFSEEDLLRVAKLNVTADDAINSLDRFFSLIKICKSMNISLSDPSDYLKFKLHQKLRDITGSDDQILLVGIDSLTLEQLKLACSERGCPENLSPADMKLKLKAWMDIRAGGVIPPHLMIIAKALVDTEAGDSIELFPQLTLQLMKMNHGFDTHNSMLRRVAKALEKSEELDPFLGAKLVEDLIEAIPWLFDDATAKELRAVARVFQNKTVQAAIRVLVGVVKLLAIPARKLFATRESPAFYVLGGFFVIFLIKSW